MLPMPAFSARPALFGQFASSIRSFSGSLRQPVEKIARQAFEQGVSFGHPFRTKNAHATTLRLPPRVHDRSDDGQPAAGDRGSWLQGRASLRGRGDDLWKRCHLARRGFTRLLDRLETGDVLVVTKLDRPGRSAMDVGSTI